MPPREKVLYHQIHPLKLATDIGAAVVALALFWHHRLIAGLLVAFLPPLAVSLVLIRVVDLERYKASALGRYIRTYMTPLMATLRLVGFGIMGVGAWEHRWWWILTGLLAILFAWLRGVLFPHARCG